MFEFSSADLASAAAVPRSNVRNWTNAGVVPSHLEIAGGGGKGRGAARTYSLAAALHVVLAARLARMTGAGMERAASMLAPFAWAGGRGGGWVDPATGGTMMTNSTGFDRLPGLPFPPPQSETLIVIPERGDGFVIPFRDVQKHAFEIAEGALVINTNAALEDLARVVDCPAQAMLKAAYRFGPDHLE